MNISPRIDYSGPRPKLKLSQTPILFLSSTYHVSGVGWRLSYLAQEGLPENRWLQ
jgi:hypothetical protein